GGNLQNLDVQRRVQVTLGAGLDLRVAALLNERRQPTDLQLTSNHDQQVGLLQLENEARLRLDEVRILIAAGDGLDRDAIAADPAGNRREVLGRGDHVQPRLRRRGCRRARDDADDSDEQREQERLLHAELLERVRAMGANRELELEQELVGRRAQRVIGAPEL